MPNHLKQFWIDALRSGEFVQGKGFLHESVEGKGYLGADNRLSRYCCLGVLAECMGIPCEPREQNVPGLHYYSYDGRWQRLDSYIRPDWLSNENMEWLIHMNDNENKTFAEIADWIEDNIR